MTPGGFDRVGTSQRPEDRAAKSTIQLVDVKKVETTGVLDGVFALQSKIVHAA